MLPILVGRGERDLISYVREASTEATASAAMSQDERFSYLAHNELNFVDLASREWVVPGGAVAQGAVKPVVARVADAGVQFVAIPHLSVNTKNISLKR